MSAMPTLSAYRDQLVRINPSTQEGRNAVDKYGNLFWRRPTQGSGVYLIPISDGIPRVAEFIIVPDSDIIRTSTEVGYGTEYIHGRFDEHGK